MNQEIFADEISAVHVTGNLVRIDLMTLQPHLKSDEGHRYSILVKRLIMPLEGFINAFALQENIMKQLIDTGVLKSNGNTENEMSDK